MADLDIVVPVYNEGGSIVELLDSFEREISTPFRVLICYDFDEDDTLTALSQYPKERVDHVFVKNDEGGPHAAVRAGFAATDAELILVYMADDDYNVHLIEPMVAMARGGVDVVCASRFVPGGSMEGCRWYKAFPARTATFTMRHLGRLPVHDSTNSFRMYTRRVIDTIEIESRVGFSFSVELLVKAWRMGWRIDELPAHWRERQDKSSRFRVLRWMPAYLRWYFHVFATTYLLRGPNSVARRPGMIQTSAADRGIK